MRQRSEEDGKNPKPRKRGGPGSAPSAVAASAGVAAEVAEAAASRSARTSGRGTPASQAMSPQSSGPEDDSDDDDDDEPVLAHGVKRRRPAAHYGSPDTPFVQLDSDDSERSSVEGSPPATRQRTLPPGQPSPPPPASVPAIPAPAAVAAPPPVPAPVSHYPRGLPSAAIPGARATSTLREGSGCGNARAVTSGHRRSARKANARALSTPDSNRYRGWLPPRPSCAPSRSTTGSRSSRARVPRTPTSRSGASAASIAPARYVVRAEEPSPGSLSGAPSPPACAESAPPPI